MVLEPDRVFLERPVRVEVEMVVIVVGIAVVLVDEILAEQVVGQLMALFVVVASVVVAIGPSELGKLSIVGRVRSLGGGVGNFRHPGPRWRPLMA